MSVTIVVGGQFGSEGKGKVAHDIARKLRSCVAVRVGGCNSGHTVIDENGKERKFQALPTSVILPQAVSVIAAGSYIDPDVLLKEIKETGVRNDRLMIDPNAVLISNEHKVAEVESGLRDSIGSTNSGTGAAVISRLLRNGSAVFAKDHAELAPFVADTRPYMRRRLDNGDRVIIEGTQGFGLSPLHSAYYPKVTTRDTTAAGFLSETGLSPLDVDDVVLVLRAFPIRVAGNSGPLPNEIDWETLTHESGYDSALIEHTTVTNNVRRVARFDAEVVRAAIEANAPTQIVMNHVDYIDATCRKSHMQSAKTEAFIADIEKQIDRHIDFVGYGPASITKNTISAIPAMFA